MPKGNQQKLKLYYLAKTMLKETDLEHGLTSQQIRDQLANKGIIVERRTLYEDIRSLELLGIHILKKRLGNQCTYHVQKSFFELAELKILVDAIQSSQFIPIKQSVALIKKLEAMTSRYHAKEMQQQVFIMDRNKADSETVYTNVDLIHDAIIKNKQICFHYFAWNENKKPVLKNDGRYYIVSPWALTFCDEKYYLISYSHEKKATRHFRVEKMINLSILNDNREGQEQFQAYNVASYTRRLFGMFDGCLTRVKMRVHKSLSNVMIDRFGKEISIRKDDAEHFIMRVDVALSRQFLGWIVSLGQDVEIIDPPEAKLQMQQMAEELKIMYGDQEPEKCEK